MPSKFGGRHSESWTSWRQVHWISTQFFSPAEAAGSKSVRYHGHVLHLRIFAGPTQLERDHVVRCCEMGWPFFEVDVCKRLQTSPNLFVLVGPLYSKLFRSYMGHISGPIMFQGFFKGFSIWPPESSLFSASLNPTRHQPEMESPALSQMQKAYL